MWTPSRRRRRARHLAALSILGALLAAPVASSAQEGPYPGLPAYPSGTWTGLVQGGVAETVKAKQWARVPMQAAAVNTNNVIVAMPPDDPRNTVLTSTNFIFLVAPSGSEHNYGISPPFTVRTVAFGSIPVEAEIQLLQRRDSSGQTLAIEASAEAISWRETPPGAPNRFQNTDTHVEDVLGVRVTRLSVDGIDLGLGNRCQTVEPGQLSLTGKGYFRSEANASEPWKTGHYAPGSGGLLTGTLDIPSFGRCTTRTGEDVSPLLSAAVSGPGNQVRLHASGPFCATLVPGVPGGAVPPGATTPEEANCVGSLPPDIEIPERTD